MCDRQAYPRDLLVKRLLKIGVASGLMTVLLWMVDWQQMSKLLAGLHWPIVGAVFGVMLVELVLSTLKWSSALRMHRIRLRFGFLFRTLCAGYFFNNFLPTAVGGDAYRVFRTLPHDGYRSRALSAVLIERFTGFAALLTLGAVGALAYYGVSAVARSYLLLYAAGTAAGFCMIALLYTGWLGGLAQRFAHVKAVDALLHNADCLVQARRGWIEQAVLSFVFQTISIGILYFLFMMSGEDVGFWQCALIGAAAGIAGFLPLSIAGIGLMEGSLVAMAGALGVGYDQAVFVAIARRLLMFALSFFCGAVYMIDSRYDPTAAEAGRGRLDVSSQSLSG
jgi:glycosyltransferase 2 family protein